MANSRKKVSSNFDMLVVFYNNITKSVKCRSLSLLRTLLPSSHFVVLLPSPPFPMHILRRDLDSYLPGSDSTVKDDNNGPIDYGKPGPHRFIGITMTVGVIFLVLMAYLIFGKRPRRALGKYCRCLGGRREEIEEVDIKQVSVGLETASYSSEEKHDVFRSISGAQVDAERRQGHSHSHDQRRNGRRLGRRLSIGPSDRDVTISPRDAEWEHHTKGSTSDKVSGLAEKLFLRSRLDQSNF